MDSSVTPGATPIVSSTGGWLCWSLEKKSVNCSGSLARWPVWLDLVPLTGFCRLASPASSFTVSPSDMGPPLVPCGLARTWKEKSSQTRGSLSTLGCSIQMRFPSLSKVWGRLSISSCRAMIFCFSSSFCRSASLARRSRSRTFSSSCRLASRMRSSSSSKWTPSGSGRARGSALDGGLSSFAPLGLGLIVLRAVELAERPITLVESAPSSPKAPAESGDGRRPDAGRLLPWEGTLPTLPVLRRNFWAPRARSTGLRTSRCMLAQVSIAAGSGSASRPQSSSPSISPASCETNAMRSCEVSALLTISDAKGKAFRCR
mmetsp:Transcript_85589/g.223360  ORF Transcript_85589/g.223360 Transcript_85589/m.223360 type:complete len:317 (-) Transcript_85589:135-1085(-)